MKEHQQDVQMLYHMIAILSVKQDSPLLSGSEQQKCKKGIKALRSAINAIETQVYA